MISIFDTETQRLSTDAGPDGRPIGWSVERRGMMGFAWGCVWGSDGLMRHYCWTEAALMAARLESSELLVSFNGIGFDVDLLEQVLGRKLTLPPHCDLLQIIKEALGHRLSLDVVAEYNLPYGKSGYSGHAPQLYKDGKFGALAAKCARDVDATRDSFFLAMGRGYLYAPDGKTIVTPAKWLQAKKDGV